ncbi:MAG: helix-turn-helix domain-containing protein [Thauera sp.]|jgi:Ner family transcriptional regulator|nr:helix-turn-helix domain-containing protein [Thauera sp.]
MKATPHTPQDWDRHAISAELRRRGLTFADLGRANGVNPRAVRDALYGSAPKYENIIAEALGLDPAQIWPSRYTAECISANPWRRAALASVGHPAAFLPPPAEHTETRVTAGHSSGRAKGRNVRGADSRTAA